MLHLKIMKLSYILLILNLFASLFVKSQDTLALKNLKNITCLSIDAKGNKYLSDDSYTLYKYNVNNKLITNVNNKSYGNITSIDCSNPFEIYVFYKDQNIIVFFDNMLNIRGEVRLNNFQMNNVSCISRSYDNQIWLVDMSENKMLKISKSGKKLIESNFLNSINQMLTNPFKIWEQNGQVYVADSTSGIIAFDIYATLDKTYPINTYSSVTGNSTHFYTNQKGLLIQYNKLLKIPTKVDLKIPKEAKLAIHNENIFYYFDNKIISILP